MTEIINDSSDLEGALSPFIDGANTTKWKGLTKEKENKENSKIRIELVGV